MNAGRQAVDQESTARDPEYQVWPLSYFGAATKHEAALSGVHCVAVSADGKLAAWAGFSPRIVVWDLERQQQKFEIATSATCFYYLQFSPDGTALAAAGRQESICLYDARTGAETKRIEVVIPDSL